MKKTLFLLMGFVTVLSLNFGICMKSLSLPLTVSDVVVNAAPSIGYEGATKNCNGQLYDCCIKSDLNHSCLFSSQSPSESACSTVTNSNKNAIDCSRIAQDSVQ